VRTWSYTLKALGLLKSESSILERVLSPARKSIFHTIWLMVPSQVLSLSVASSTGKKALSHAQETGTINFCWGKFPADSDISSWPVGI